MISLTFGIIRQFGALIQKNMIEVIVYMLIMYRIIVEILKNIV